MKFMQYLSATLCVILLAMCIGCRNKLSEYVDFPKDGVVSSMSLRQAIANEKSLQENSAYLHTATRQVTVEKILGDGRLIVGDGTDYFILATKSDLDIGQTLSTGAYLYKGMDEIDDLFGKRIELPYFCEINPSDTRKLVKDANENTSSRRRKMFDERMQTLSQKLSALNFNLDELFHFQDKLRKVIVEASVREEQWYETRDAICSQNWNEANRYLCSMTNAESTDEAIDSFRSMRFHLRVRLIDDESARLFLYGSLRQFSQGSQDYEDIRCSWESDGVVVVSFELQHAPYYIFAKECISVANESEVAVGITKIRTEREIGNLTQKRLWQRLPNSSKHIAKKLYHQLNFADKAMTQSTLLQAGRHRLGA